MILLNLRTTSGVFRCLRIRPDEFVFQRPFSSSLLQKVKRSQKQRQLGFKLCQLEFKLCQLGFKLRSFVSFAGYDAVPTQNGFVHTENVDVHTENVDVHTGNLDVHTENINFNPSS